MGNGGGARGMLGCYWLLVEVEVGEGERGEGMRMRRGEGWI